MALTITTPAGVQRIPDTAGMANPMTDPGDQIVGGVAGAPTRQPVGSNGDVWQVLGGSPSWGPAPSGGVDTSLQAAPDTGWTAGGNGTAAIAAGVATLTVTDAQTGARLTRKSPCSGFLPAVEVMARVTRATAPSGGSAWHGLTIGSPAGDRGYLVQVDDASNVSVFWNNAGTWTYQANAVAAASWDSGTLWLRIVCTPKWCSLYQGVGVGATPPASWSLVHTFDTDSPSMATVIGLGLLTDVATHAGRSGGTGDLVLTTQNFTVRSLLGAPT